MNRDSKGKFIKGNIPYFKNKIMPQEVKDKISRSKKGVTAWNKGKKTKKHSWNYIDGRSKFLGPDRYGDDWNKIRLIIYKRDNYSCQKCGINMNETKKAHHVHHIKPFVESNDNSLKNLITLCPSCHRKIEAKLMKKTKLYKEEILCPQQSEEKVLGM